MIENVFREVLDSTPRRSGGHEGAEEGGCAVPAGGEASGRRSSYRNGQSQYTEHISSLERRPEASAPAGTAHPPSSAPPWPAGWPPLRHGAAASNESSSCLLTEHVFDPNSSTAESCAS